MPYYLLNEAILTTHHEAKFVTELSSVPARRRQLYEFPTISLTVLLPDKIQIDLCDWTPLKSEQSGKEEWTGNLVFTKREGQYIPPPPIEFPNMTKS